MGTQSRPVRTIPIRSAGKRNGRQDMRSISFAAELQNSASSFATEIASTALAQPPRVSLFKGPGTERVSQTELHALAAYVLGFWCSTVRLIGPLRNRVERDHEGRYQSRPCS
jgi:hypothetical protein